MPASEFPPNFCTFCENFYENDMFMSDRCRPCHDRIWKELQEEDAVSQCPVIQSDDGCTITFPSLMWSDMIIMEKTLGRIGEYVNLTWINDDKCKPCGLKIEEDAEESMKTMIFMKISKAFDMIQKNE